MADVPEVAITSGVPTSGTGTVQTLSTVTDRLGATTGAAVITDANGTIQQYLRGLVTRWVNALGAGTEAAALRVTLSSDGPGATSLTAISDKLSTIQTKQDEQTAFFTGWDAEGAALVGGDIAHDAADAGLPLSTGFQARTTNPTAVVDGDRVRGIADKVGKQVVVGSLRAMKVRQTTALTASTTETTILTAVASTFLDLYGLIITNTSATAVASVTIRDTTAGSAVLFIAVPAGETRGFMLPESGAIPQTTVNTNWTAQSGTSVSSLQITALAVKNL